VPTLPAEGPGAASNLRAEVECSLEDPSQGVAKLSWTVASTVGSEQRVDLTIYGFEDGKFKSSESLPSDQASLVWDELSGRGIHFWRVLTLQPDGWKPSETATFEGPACVANFADG
jgi:hypothetical protein